MTQIQVPVSVGIYGQPEAAHLLRITPERMRRWVGGYTYLLRSSKSPRSQRRQAPLVRTGFPIIDGRLALSFLELMELRVVKALLGKGLSLQHVRSAAQLATERFSTAHPFASRRVFTDGRHIFSALAEREGRRTS